VALLCANLLICDTHPYWLCTVAVYACALHVFMDTHFCK